jgi:hypothetical protein
MSTKIQLRRDTSTNWTRNNPVLALGEPGLETDTQIVKYGDGFTSWNLLPYANINSLADFTTTSLVEGSNLYFSNARVYANVSIGFPSNVYVTTRLATKANISDLNLLSTSNIAEGSKLFFTNDRVYANVALAATTYERVITNPYDSIDYSNYASATPLALDKQSHILVANTLNYPHSFYLANGREGQVINLVLSGNCSSNVYVWMDNMNVSFPDVANVNYPNSSTGIVTANAWICFKNNRTYASAIFLNGAWNIDGGSWTNNPI